MVFNYLGQFDQVVAGSTTVPASPPNRRGPWHSPRQRRRHALEVNGLVIGGRLELWLDVQRTPARHGTAIRQLADEFIAALQGADRALRCHPSAAGAPRRISRSPDWIRPRSTGWSRRRSDIEDIYPLSPIQTLFLLGASGRRSLVGSISGSARCTGDLNVAAFQRAWQETVRRHAILRSTIHGDGLRGAAAGRASSRAAPLDASRTGAARRRRSTQNAWSDFLRCRSRDAAGPDGRCPSCASRWLRLADDRWKFLWSVPALLLDGWSWPLVFRDVSRFYDAFVRRTRRADRCRFDRTAIIWTWLGRQLQPRHSASSGARTSPDFSQPDAVAGRARPGPTPDDAVRVKHSVELPDEHRRSPCRRRRAACR